VWRVPVREADSAAIADAITDQLIRADLVVITTGGTSAERDQIRAIMAALGPTDLADIAVEPGRSQSIAVVGADDDQVPVILLSGDPGDSYVSYIAFVRPLIRKLMAREPYVQKGVRAITTTIIRAPKDEVALVRGVVTEEIGGRRVVEPLPLSDEHQLGDLTRANALIVVPEGHDMVRAGDPVQVLLLDEE
ncbi:MAG: molybdopterin-binding protein, partial [Propionibacteriaceae bacterium]